jgi:hypothetical protein
MSEAATVYARFVEAASVSGRPNARPVGPRGYGASWIRPEDMRADPLDWVEMRAIYEGERDGTREEEAQRPAPDVISRADEVITAWVPTYLANLPDETTCLWAHAGAHVGWGSFRKFCRRNGLNERTGRRMKDKALQAVVVGLRRDGRDLHQIGRDTAPQIDEKEGVEDVVVTPAFIRFHEGDDTFVPRTPAEIAAFEKHLAKVNKRRRKLQQWAERARVGA